MTDMEVINQAQEKPLKVIKWSKRKLIQLKLMPAVILPITIAIMMFIVNEFNYWIFISTIIVSVSFVIMYFLNKKSEVICLYKDSFSFKASLFHSSFSVLKSELSSFDIGRGVFAGKAIMFKVYRKEREISFEVPLSILSLPDQQVLIDFLLNEN